MDKTSSIHSPKPTFTCPLPQLDFDVITLAHGSGGLLTYQLLDCIFGILKTEATTHHDGAVLSLKQPMAFTTDSFVVTPIFFPGGNIGDLAVNGTLNDLAMCGAKPHALSLSLIIEEGLPVNELWEILVAIKKACEAAGVKIVTGDTKVVEKGKGDKLFINTTGIGEVHPKANISSRNIKAGDKIILSGQAACHGMAIMSVREGLLFETELKSDTRNLAPAIFKLLDVFGDGIHFLRDPTRGGIATVLNELALESGYGIDLIQTAISVNERVEGACEMLGLDPLYVANEGLFIAVIDASISDEFLSVLQNLEEGKHAAIIGSVTEAHPKQVVMTSAIGGRRLLTMLLGEQLPRIC
ncbi:hydrogenase expression/formation protein HypE [Pontibacter sp. CAU 1760]